MQSIMQSAAVLFLLRSRRAHLPRERGPHFFSQGGGGLAYSKVRNAHSLSVKHNVTTSRFQPLCIHTIREHTSHCARLHRTRPPTSSHISPTNACEHGFGWHLDWCASSWRLRADMPVPCAHSTIAAIQLHTESVSASTRAPCPVLDLVSFFDQPSIRDHSWNSLLQHCRACRSLLPNLAVSRGAHHQRSA